MRSRASANAERRGMLAERSPAGNLSIMKERTHFEVGQFLLLNEKYDEAIEEFKKALADNPKDVEAYYNLGVTYEAKHMREDAKDVFRNVLELDPRHKLAEEHLSKLIGA